MTACLPADAMHYPTACVRELHVLREEEAHSWCTVYEVVLPIGPVAEYRSRRHAQRLVAAYLAPDATRASVTSVRDAIAADLADAP